MMTKIATSHIHLPGFENDLHYFYATWPDVGHLIHKKW
jgi:hypothetical protein